MYQRAHEAEQEGGHEQGDGHVVAVDDDGAR